MFHISAIDDGLASAKGITGTGWVTRKFPARRLAVGETAGCQPALRRRVDTVALRLCLPATAGTYDMANTAGTRTLPTPLRFAGRRSPRSARTATRANQRNTQD